MKKQPDKFTFAPSDFIPFRDTKAIARVRKIKRKDITRHRNPDFRISVIRTPIMNSHGSPTCSSG